MRCDSEFIQNLPGGAVCANTMSGLSVCVCVFVRVCVYVGGVVMVVVRRGSAE